MKQVDPAQVVDLAGDIPVINLENGRKPIENYRIPGAAICITNPLTFISRGIHAHDSYEFVICNADIPSAICGNMVYERSNNTMFAINPMQEHGMAAEMKGFNLIGVHYDRAYFQNVAEEIFGSPYIKFENNSSVVGYDVKMLVSLFLDELKYDQTGHEFAMENLILVLLPVTLSGTSGITFPQGRIIYPKTKYVISKRYWPI